MFAFSTWWKRISLPNLKSPKLTGKNRRINLAAEVLEDRSVPALLTPSFDGSNHNPANPDWGAANTDFLRKSPASYADGISAPAGVNRANPREISNVLAAEPEGNQANSRDVSAFVYIWGQFIDHDLDLTNTDPAKVAFNITVPKGDAYFDPNSTGTKTIDLNRSQSDPATGTSKTNPRQQVNSTTAWMDASMVYGPDATTALKLRSLEGGKMKVGENNLLPIDPSTGQPMAGDPRATENPELTSLHVLFLREHNRLAGLISAANPGLSDEQIFQKARLQVIGEIQAITYNEFLPALLGSASLKPYAGYKPQVNPAISNEFATAAYRLGHSMVTTEVELLDSNGNSIAPPIELRDAFFDPTLLTENGIEPFLKYLASDRANEIDTRIVDDLRNFLFGPPGSGGFDLAALNIQRGRDHGLADYNTTRAAFGLPKITSFAQITSNVSMQKNLEKLYGNVNNIDLWVGGLAEDHLKGSSLGPTFAKIVTDQFQRIRDGDSFWYQNVFKGNDLGRLDHLRMADLIRLNSNLTNIQDNVFLFKASISGTVFADGNQDGTRNRPEQGLAGRKVELVGDTGAVIATALTGLDGSYRFDHLDLGTYTIREVLPTGTKSTQAPTTVTLTKGMDFSQVNLGEVAIKAPASTPPTKPPAPNTPGTPPGGGLIAGILQDPWNNPLKPKP